MGIAGAAIGGAISKKLMPKAKATETQAQPVVPLPDETGAASKLRVLQARRQTSRRRGLSSTLVGGQLGDVRAPTTAAPLVLGRVG